MSTTSSRQTYTAQPNDEEDDREDLDAETLEQFVAALHNTKNLGEGYIPSAEWLKSQFRTKSAAIRFLDTQGYKPKEISKCLDIRQQHVRNVLAQNLKRGPNERFDIETKWGCSHDKLGRPFIDVILRKNVKDPNSSRVLYRVCILCAQGFIPGVNEETIQKYLPGIKASNG